jgi:glycosyltransferase involved in cell wall biosynthesis
MSHPMGLQLARLAASLQLRRMLVVAGMWSQRRQLTLVCSNVYLFDAARSLLPQLLVTDICDDPRNYPGEPPWTADFLRRAIRFADVVTTSSRALEAEFRTAGARNLTYVPNGIHAAFVREATSRHKEATSTALGFVGHLGSWVDFELLARLAAELPLHRLQLVGSVDPGSRREFEAVRAYPNVTYTPAVPYAEVPRVMAGFSVGLIPFRVSSYTRAVNPIKLYEYAALDLPIVSTAFSPDVVQFQSEIDVCSTPEAFISVSRERADGRGRRSTRRIAEAHIWEQIAEAFAVLLN